MNGINSDERLFTISPVNTIKSGFNALIFSTRRMGMDREFPKVPTCKSENWTMRYPLKAAGSLADSIVTSFMSNCRGVTIAFHHKRMKHATLTAKPAI